MISPSLVDEVTVFLHRVCSLVDSEHTDEFVSLFTLPGAAFMPVDGLEALDCEEAIRKWHQSVFGKLDILELNVDLLHCQHLNEVIFIQSCFHCQFCLSESPDQLEATSIRVSMTVHQCDKAFRIMQMHCSLPRGGVKLNSQTELVDPFADE